jgi:predicted RNase H-like nuclease (RuvC/YqgF family)
LTAPLDSEEQRSKLLAELEQERKKNQDLEAQARKYIERIETLELQLQQACSVQKRESANEQIINEYQKTIHSLNNVILEKEKQLKDHLQDTSRKIEDFKVKETELNEKCLHLQIVNQDLKQKLQATQKELQLQTDRVTAYELYLEQLGGFQAIQN